MAKSFTNGAWTDKVLLYALTGMLKTIFIRAKLVHILPEYFQSANIWAVYVTRLAMSAKVRVSVEFLRRYFNEHYGAENTSANGGTLKR